MDVMLKRQIPRWLALYLVPILIAQGAPPLLIVTHAVKYSVWLTGSKSRSIIRQAARCLCVMRQVIKPGYSTRVHVQERCVSFTGCW